MKRTVLFLGLWLAAMASAWAVPPPSLFLPAEFGSWHLQSSKTSADPDVADAAYGPVLKEYGFNELQSATYTQPGRKLIIKAARFNDTTGAYGAFTFYKTPEMLREQIGDQGASLNQRVLFYRGNLVVDAVFDRLTAMSAAELRELAGDLPLPAGNARNLPSLPAYLPKQSYLKNTAKYVVGPAGLQNVNAPIDAETVDFTRGAEAALGHYATSAGEATLMLISYPTPQIAADRLKAIDAGHPNAQSGRESAAGNFLAKRTGPLVALVSGDISTSEAKSLLASVNYDAEVTWNENTFFGKRNNVGNLIVNIFFLVGILIGVGLLIGLAFGGVRVLLTRLYPDRFFGGSDEREIIRLHLLE